MSASGHTGRVGTAQAGGRVGALVASAVVAARFLPIWLATGALVIVAAIIAPNAIKSTSWAFVLPYMTILAIAALGQMLVIMHAGIDLSTPGVISLGGNLLVGVSRGPTTDWRSGSSRASASERASASSTASSSGSSG